MLRTQFLVLAAIAATCSHGLALQSTTAPVIDNHQFDVIAYMLRHYLTPYSADKFELAETMLKDEREDEENDVTQAPELDAHQYQVLTHMIKDMDLTSYTKDKFEEALVGVEKKREMQALATRAKLEKEAALKEMTLK